MLLKTPLMYLPPKFKGSPAIPSTNACSSVVFLLLFCRIAKAKALKKEVGLEVGPNRWWYKSDLVGTNYSRGRNRHRAWKIWQKE